MTTAKIQSHESSTPVAHPANNHDYPLSAMAVAVDDGDAENYNNNNNYRRNNNGVSTSNNAHTHHYGHHQQEQTRHGPPMVENSKYVHIDTRRPVQLSSCPNCAKQHVPTRTRTKATGTTWACVVAGVIIFWPLCWVPLVADPMKQTNHYCQNCGVKIGRVKPFRG